MNDKPMQAILYAMGMFACYFLCLVYRAAAQTKKYIDPYAAWCYCRSQTGVDGKPWIDDAMFLWHPEAVYEWLSGKRVSVRKENPDYVPRSGEWVVQRWEWTEQTTGQTVVHAHFVLPDYDPWGESATRKNGVLASLRVFTEV